MLISRSRFSHPIISSKCEAVANEQVWLLWHPDIKEAHFQAHLNEYVCMRLPDRCGDMSGEVVLLQRAVRGLRLAW